AELAPKMRLSTPDGRFAWEQLIEVLASVASLASLKALSTRITEHAAALRAEWGNVGQSGDSNRWWSELDDALRDSSAAANELDQRLERLAAQAESLATGMDFSFLYNPHRRLFAIGFNIEDGMLDRSHYDMLASEARLASYLAIAKGDVDHRTWFR